MKEDFVVILFRSCWCIRFHDVSTFSLNLIMSWWHLGLCRLPNQVSIEPLCLLAKGNDYTVKSDPHENKQTSFFYNTLWAMGSPMTATKSECLWQGGLIYDRGTVAQDPRTVTHTAVPPLHTLLCSPKDWQRLLGKAVLFPSRRSLGNRSAYLQRPCSHCYSHYYWETGQTRNKCMELKSAGESITWRSGIRAS